MVGCMNLTALYVWRNVAKMYLPLESLLSTQAIADECLISIDPEFPDDVELAYRIAARSSKFKVFEFRWPNNLPGDGSRIGAASQHALNQIAGVGNYVLNVQADEIYPEELARFLKDNWRNYAGVGIECLSLKVLNLEHNMSQYQGGDAGSTWNQQCGAGYNRSIKLFRRCPNIKFAHDGWSMEGCAIGYHLDYSEVYPIIHAHDNWRDTLIELRQNAAEEIWTDRVKFGHYKASADHLAEGRDEWWNDPKWTRADSRFIALLPPYVRTLLGKTRYEVRWELLNEYL
jgi:hypothetical protein